MVAIRFDRILHWPRLFHSPVLCCWTRLMFTLLLWIIWKQSVSGSRTHFRFQGLVFKVRRSKCTVIHASRGLYSLDSSLMMSPWPALRDEVVPIVGFNVCFHLVWSFYFYFILFFVFKFLSRILKWNFNMTDFCFQSVRYFVLLVCCHFRAILVVCLIEILDFSEIFDN